ncbi:3-oxoacyl-ACP reductase FabG [Lentibacillus saliphilus]|uniref:3-oxoacyl-ACP reductase FabG n=1 Tax=Lentibacillus saliphilus TaxID=2737028 RepID=UPI001C310FA3|nr:3-oxoacyl-ACP reductase FabG [Lentibacillus saliphilus]
MTRLKERVAIITGGAQGIGFSTAQRFAEEGAVVVIADFDQDKGLQSEQALRNEHARCKFIPVDVADRTNVDALVATVKQEFGRIDILVNNAGITKDAMLRKMTPDQFEHVIQVNLSGVFNCTQAVAPIMIEQEKGKIISTSSVSGVYGNVGQTNYAAAKAGIIGMTKTWAKELGRKGINVNAVVPGFTETRMVETVPQNVIDQIKSQIPMQRLGRPEDIANAYLFLASEESEYINGHALHVDGGIMM